MMNDLKIFECEEFGAVRLTDILGKTYFSASDVAKALGYSNPRAAIIRHCKGVMKRDWVSISKNQHGKETEQINQMSFIPEGDVYRLIVRSKLPTAERFERWVFDEVLPSIRRHGAYAKEELLDNPDLFIEVLKELKNERVNNQKLKLENLKQKQIIGELKPKSDYTDKILRSTSLLSINQIAKDYGMSAIQMNRILHNLGIQYKQGEQWLLYSKYHDKGYTHSETFVVKHSDGTTEIKMITKWTQKGRLFLYQKLKSEGFIPNIEKLSAEI